MNQNSHIINRLKHQPRHGNMMDDAKKAAEDLWKTFDSATGVIKKTGDALVGLIDTMDTIATPMGKYARGLDKVIKTNEFFAESINSIYKSMSILEVRNAAINKAFGINSRSAAKLSNSFQQISKNLKITNDQTNQYASAIHKLIPTVNQLDKENNTTYQGLIATQHVLQTQLGLTEELTNSYSLYATQTGKNAATQLEIADLISKQLDPAGTIGVFNSIVSDIAETSADIQLQFGRVPGQLEVASLKAKQLGFSIAQIAKTGDNLLNIESSIGQELEYQLLSGHRLVDLNGRSLTDAYRQATLQGDQVKMADSLNTILEQEGDVLRGNLIARRQMAELLGTDEATLSRALQKKKLLEEAGMKGIDFNLVGDDLMSALKSANVDSKKIAEIMKSDEHDTRTTNDILAQQLQVAQDMKIMMMLQGSSLKNNGAVVAALQTAMKQDAESRDKKNPFLELNESELHTLGNVMFSKQLFDMYDAVPGEITSTAGSSKMQTAPDVITKDAIIPPGLGGVISMPAGTVGFQENDGIAIGTNIASNATANSSNNKDIMQMAAAIVAAIQQQTRALKQDTVFGQGMNASYFS